jgi:hypothetical protein
MTVIRTRTDKAHFRGAPPKRRRPRLGSPLTPLIAGLVVIS